MENPIFEAAERFAVKFGVPVGAVLAGCCLVVLAQGAGEEQIRGVVSDPDGGSPGEVLLPWRVRLRELVERVAGLPLPPARLLVRLADADSSQADSHPSILIDLDRREVAAEPLLCSRLQAALAAEPELPAGRAWLWSAEDERIVAAAHSPRSWDTTETVASLIRRHMLDTPDAVAIEEGSRAVTYRQLGELVAGLAGQFARAGAGPGDMVGIGLPRRVETIAALLAVWSLGAGFLPLDLKHPPLRLGQQLTAAGARFAVLPDDAALDLPGIHVLSASADPVPGEVPAFPVALDGVAYALSTSGSTGVPKAVAIPHAALRHSVGAIGAMIGADRPHVTCMATLTFDMSTMEIFLPLARGGRLVLVREELQRDPERLAAWLTGRPLQLVQATPTTWRMTVPYLPEGGLRDVDVICGGEALSADLVAALHRTGARVWNGYGPTEVTIYTVTHLVPEPPLDPIPIGRPLAGTRAAVLDQWGRTAPVGQVGELVLGGPQLAIGYVGDPDRTAAVFQHHPELGRIYRTGDLCAWRRDGALAYHGRIDHQVKLRGQRIELEEIEAVAERHPDVTRAAALVVEHTAGDQRLALYAQATRVQPAELRAHLEQWLPRALMPQWITILPSLPRTGSQKIDRRALQRHAAAAMETR
ncbi:amino acid adenylation domain-containing protein [Acrocarpospora catenulata]|uniref:amino acid adenylation domain-containing protein n=1 Tax=Acrocarpospora catenulata TaxID=2836182 RepID=UPI001BDA54E5|nr:amino acid adenylation domain-containing protein [Acrocarpospora catenulata]